MDKSFICSPNLPKNNVSTVIIGKAYESRLKNAFDRLKIRAISAEPSRNVDNRISNHIDLQLIHLGKNKFVANKDNIDLVNILTDYGAEVFVSESSLDSTYPDDCILNACIINEHIIHNLDITDFAILKNLNKSIKPINVQQGYSKCNVCILNSKSIITSDKKIADATERCGFEVLLIKPGYISLPGYEYGFIGGASVKLSENTVAFTGKFDKHPDCQKILDFITERKISIEYLSHEDIFDVGSIIPIFEN